MKKFLLICTLFYSALFAYAGPEPYVNIVLITDCGTVHTVRDGVYTDDELCDMLDAWTMIDCGYDPDPNQHGGF